MIYKSKPTARGNVGVSRWSQKLADLQASQMDANGCNYCNNCRSCPDCTNCTNCTGCRSCNNCHGILVWSGHEAKSLLGISGLRWPVSISKTHIQIGCQYHSIEEWDSFGDEVISSMNSKALSFWIEYKELIMLVANQQIGRQQEA